MERSRVTRYIRIGITGLSLTACVLFAALWLRSYWWIDAIRWTSHKYGLRILTSDYGRLMILRHPDYSDGGRGGWRMRSYRVEDVVRLDERRKNPPPRFAWWFNRHNGNLTVRAPHWLLVAAGMVLAAMPWIRSRFSLRTLLIGTALVAVTLGIVAVSS
jgi:hypothetical protein